MRAFTPLAPPRLTMAVGVAVLFILSACACKHESREVPVHRTVAAQQADLSGMPANKVLEKHKHAKASGIKKIEPARRSDLSKQPANTAKKRKKTATTTAERYKKNRMETKQPPAITLDVLTRRLKQTDAIGVFTKLAIRSDIMDLKDDIQTYRRKSALQSKLGDVRARFDGLLMKIMALLEADPELSRDLYSARETIWKSLLGVKA